MSVIRLSIIRLKKNLSVIGLLVISVILINLLFTRTKQHSQKIYTANELGIKELQADLDTDEDGVDDYTDIYEGAKAYIALDPKYKSKYYEGGYPDDGYGVCTDVIWNAFKAAGYNLKEMVDKDISENPSAYPTIKIPDTNIDFRRVKNLNIFFNRKAQVLTTESIHPEEWQAGDIVVFSSHIAICSNKRNKDGIPFLIHHDSHGAREANDIENYTVVGHYRWYYEGN